MHDSLIVVCDERSVVFGQDMYQASAYVIEDLAKAAGTDHLEIREALLVLGGEIDGPHPIDQGAIMCALKELQSLWRHYDENEEACIEKAVVEAFRRKREVFCSFSLC